MMAGTVFVRERVASNRSHPSDASAAGTRPPGRARGTPVGTDLAQRAPEKPVPVELTGKRCPAPGLPGPRDPPVGLGPGSLAACASLARVRRQAPDGVTGASNGRGAIPGKS